VTAGLALNSAVDYGSRTRGHNKNKNNVYCFWQPKAGLSPHAVHKHIKEIHANMLNTANVVDKWL